jgi:VCBS repeat-containing protein
MRILKVGFFGAYRVLLFAVLPFLTSPFASATDVTMVPKEATWKYLDGNVNPGAEWEARVFDDTSWSSGPGPLGGGDTHINTAVNIGLDGARYRNVFYRKSFTVSSAGAFQSLTLNLLRDDGALVYLNGTQVVADGVAAPFNFDAWATQAVGGTDETTYFSRTIPVNALIDGVNVIAVVCKQCNATSSDLGFDLELIGTLGISITLNGPAAGETAVPIPATLTATATDPEGQPLTVGFFGRRAVPPPPDFTIVVLPDTQNYTAEINGGTKEILLSQTQWIVDNRVVRNIVYVAQEGDISQNGDLYVSEWQNAVAGLSLLEDQSTTFLPEGIPYGTAVGNHDQLNPNADGDGTPTTYYNQNFGSQRFQGRSYYGGHYGANNNNHYDIFTAGGMDFIVIYFEFDTTASTAVLQWANELLQAHNNRRAIVVSHYLLDLNGGWGYQGQAIYNALKGNTNLFLMLCGHNHGEARRTDVFNNSKVDTLLADYQSYTGGGNGFLRILEFSPSQNQIRVKTYSPWLDQYETDASSEFTLDYDMTSGPAFELVQQRTGVSSGTETSATWSGLLPGTQYEWLVQATDGADLKTSEVRRFTTVNNLWPTVAIDSPATGTIFITAPATFTVTATSDDADGTVASVEFFVNGISAGTDLVSPYEVEILSLAAGSYMLTAVATDSADAQTTSAPVQVTVGAPPTAPSGLVATPLSRTEVGLAWTDNSLNEDGFRIYQKSGAADYTLASTTGPDVTFATVTDLLPGTAYVFMVQAFNVSGTANSDAATATTSLNAPPTANSDGYTLNEDEMLSVPTAFGVLANDVDLDNDSLTAILVTSPTNGVLSLNADGSFTYTPTPDVNGIDTFTYQASDGFTTSPATVTITITPVNDAPSVPSDVAAAPASGLVTLSWTASTDPDGDDVTYSIYRRTGAEAYGDTPFASTTATTFSDTSVNNGTTYYYVVRAVDPSGTESAASTEVSATSNLLPVDVFVTQNPVVSSGTLAGNYAATFDADGISQTITEAGTANGASLQADYVLATSANPSGVIALSLFLTAQWSDLDGASDGLVVSIRNESTGVWENIAGDIADGEFVALRPQDYIAADGRIQVRFTDSASFRREKKGSLSIDQLFARIVSGAPDTTPPGAPVGLTAQAGDSQVQLDWGDNTESDLAGYNVYRGDGTIYDLVNTAALVTASAYTDSGLVNGPQYSYIVTAVDHAGNESLPSNDADATPVDGPPSAPTGLIATARDGEVQLDWADNPETDVTGYRVYRADGTLLTSSPITTSQYLDTGLLNGQQYTYYVTAVDATFESVPSSTVSATPTPQTTMHVESIVMNPLTPSGKSYKASGTAFVVTAANQPLAGAVVTAEWWLNTSGSSSFLQTQTVTANGSGAAAFTSPPVKATSGSTFTLRITGVVLSGYEFSPGDGVTEAGSPPVP